MSTYAIILNMALPEEYCGDAIRAIPAAYYFSKWTLYMMVVAKGNMMDVSKAFEIRFKVMGVMVTLVSPLVLLTWMVDNFSFSAPYPFTNHAPILCTIMLRCVYSKWP